MIRLLFLAPILLLAGCASMSAFSCDNADAARAAAELTIRAIDRACPIP